MTGIPTRAVIVMPTAVVLEPAILLADEQVRITAVMEPFVNSSKSAMMGIRTTTTPALARASLRSAGMAF